jgi:hypothetical protein
MELAGFHTFRVPPAQIADQRVVRFLIPEYGAVLAGLVAFLALDADFFIMFDVSQRFVDGQGSDRTGVDAETLVALQTVKYFDIGQFFIVDDSDPSLSPIEIPEVGEGTDQLTTQTSRAFFGNCFDKRHLLPPQYSSRNADLNGSAFLSVEILPRNPELSISAETV